MTFCGKNRQCVVKLKTVAVPGRLTVIACFELGLLLLPIFIFMSDLYVVVICRTDCDTVYQLFVDVFQVTGGECYIHQQYPTDNVDNVTSSFAR